MWLRFCMRDSRSLDSKPHDVRSIQRSSSSIYAEAPKSREFQRLRRRLTRQVETALREFLMIEDGDHVMVCCSGGKDSFTLLTLMQDLAGRESHNFTLTAFNLDQAHPGFPQTVLPEYFEKIGIQYLCHRQDTFKIVSDKIPLGKTACGLCSRLRRGIIYTKAAEIGATKIALGHHMDDAVETLMLNLFFGARLKAMPPKLSALAGRHTLIRPLYNCSEQDIARFARAMAYPIIPCDLCGSQPNLQRKKFKALISELEKIYPGRRETLFKAMRHVVPSHLADSNLFDFKDMKPRMPGKDTRVDASQIRSEDLAELMTEVPGFMSELEPSSHCEHVINKRGIDFAKDAQEEMGQECSEVNL